MQRLRVDCVSVCVRAKSETKSQNEQLLARHELVSDAQVESEFESRRNEKYLIDYYINTINTTLKCEEQMTHKKLVYFFI